ncbi:acyl-CoA synthetase [Cohnella xylanilytica]|uniref:AMP-binding protein n=1 Tax=Cohnella xylanilytica TaxID=557555 RepID=UPI001B2C483A|nr:AMP-binding protein [Cohnella xylanilytica]GIO13722.1 acyl-CoA synthetase [Cohnella xylanilytica]
MFIVNKQRYSRGDFERRKRELAESIPRAGREGKLVALCLTEPLDILAALETTIDGGGSVLLLNGETPAEEARRKAEEAGCAGIFHAGGGPTAYAALRPSAPRTSAEPSLLQYSSGTTGEPKLIERPWRDVVAEIEAYNRAYPGDSNDSSGSSGGSSGGSSESGGSGGPGGSGGGSETPIILVPVSHSFGLIAGALAALRRGAEPILVTDRNPRFAVGLIERTPRHVVYAVPFLLHVVASLMRDRISLRKVVSSGSPLPLELMRRLADSGVRIVQQYGCTEAGCIAIGDNPSSPSDVGRPLDSVRVEAAGTPDTPAEVTVSASGRLVRTGDLGYVSEGRLHVLGRIDDLINVSGQKVIPSEVEDVILRLEGVREAVVHRTSHPVWGEAVKARIVPGRPDLTAAEVKEWCMKRLPAYKVPSAIEFAGEIPRTANGKLIRQRLD